MSLINRSFPPFFSQRAGFVELAFIRQCHEIRNRIFLRKTAAKPIVRELVQRFITFAYARNTLFCKLSYRLWRRGATLCDVPSGQTLHLIRQHRSVVDALFCCVFWRPKLELEHGKTQREGANVYRF
jgi:hypothetical protein